MILVSRKVTFTLILTSNPVDKLKDLYRFQSLASELISPRIQINSGEEIDKGARGFTASTASVYRLLARKITLSDLNNYLPGLEILLNFNRRLRKLWQVTWNPACKTTVIASPKPSEE
jgi:hypothetical protein